MICGCKPGQTLPSFSKFACGRRSPASSATFVMFVKNKSYYQNDTIYHIDNNLSWLNLAIDRKKILFWPRLTNVSEVFQECTQLNIRHDYEALQKLLPSAVPDYCKSKAAAD